MHPRSCFRKWKTSKSHLTASRGKREMTLRHFWPLTTEVPAAFLPMPLKATSQLLGASSSSRTCAPEHLGVQGTKLSEVSCLLSIDRQYLRSDHVLHRTSHHCSLKCTLAYNPSVQPSQCPTDPPNDETKTKQKSPLTIIICSSQITAREGDRSLCLPQQVPRLLSLGKGSRSPGARDMSIRQVPSWGWTGWP